MPVCAIVHPCTGVLRNPSYTDFFRVCYHVFLYLFLSFRQEKEFLAHSSSPREVCLPLQDFSRPLRQMRVFASERWRSDLGTGDPIHSENYFQILSGSWSWGSLQGVHPINSRPETRHIWHGRNLRPKAPGSTNHWKPELKPEISYPYLLFQHCSPRCQGAHRVEHSLCSGTGLWVSTSAAPADPLRSVPEHLFEHFIRLCQAAPVTGEDNLCSSLSGHLNLHTMMQNDAKWCFSDPLHTRWSAHHLGHKPSQDSAKASCGVMAPDALGGEPSQLNQENQNFSRHPSDRNRF